jgi:hypothetical protein
MEFSLFGRLGVSPHFELDRRPSGVDFDQWLRAFRVELYSFLKSEPYLIHGLTSMLQVREDIELPYSRVPALTFNPVSVVKVQNGSAVSLLSAFGTIWHELVHLDQILHESVFDAYIQTERAIDRFKKMIRDKKDKIVLKNIIKLTEAGIWFNPLKIEKDKRRLLEAPSLINQLYGISDIGRKLIAEQIQEIGNEKLDKLIIAYNYCISKYSNLSDIYGDAMKLIWGINQFNDEKLQTLYILLLAYSSMFSDFGASDFSEFLIRIKNNHIIHIILRYLELQFMKDFDAVGTGCISNELEKFMGERLSFSSYRENILGEINSVLEKLEGFSKKRVKLLKEAIERSGKPSQFLDKISNPACLILKDQESSCYYPVAIGRYDPDYFSLKLSFYSDLYICTSILKAAKEAFRKGKGPWKAMERAIKCPYRNAPQMECREKSECEHEKPWLDAVVER